MIGGRPGTRADRRGESTRTGASGAKRDGRSLARRARWAVGLAALATVGYLLVRWLLGAPLVVEREEGTDEVSVVALGETGDVTERFVGNEPPSPPGDEGDDEGPPGSGPGEFDGGPGGPGETPATGENEGDGEPATAGGDGNAGAVAGDEDSPTGSDAGSR